MITGLVKDQTISSLDDFAHTYVPWWDKTGDKGQVTLRQLLSFTSGFGEGTPGNENATSTCMDNATNYPGVTFDSCAQMIYENTTLHGTPGKTFSYNSVHLQLAGAVATHAANMTIQQVVSKYLLGPYQMNNTYCNEPTAEIPQLAVCLNTTGRDYASFLHKTLTKSVLGADLVAESEKDYTPFLPKVPFAIYGDYAFGHFRECFDSYNGYNADCEQANVHADPGAFGFYPLIDRQHEYYMEIVAFEGSYVSYPRSGIPEYLRQLVKPLVDAVIVAGDDPIAHLENVEKFAHHTPSLNGRSKSPLATDNLLESTDGVLHPKFSRGGSLLPSIYADARYIDAVVVPPGLGLADVNYIVQCYVDPESCE